MNRYQPQPGDRVTSWALTGEWSVDHAAGQYGWLSSGECRVLVPLVDLTPVAPPLPPEPAVGSVVRAHGQLWQRDTSQDIDSRWFAASPPRRRPWSGLATADDLSPVVAVDDVADRAGRAGYTATVDWLRAEFGGYDERKP